MSEAPETFPSADGTPRFEVRGLLGRGANGVVYRVLDRETGREVALKTLASPDADQVYHLKKEFRALATLSHPNLVHLDELVVDRGACFFSMELVEGHPFTDVARELATDDGWTDEGIARLEAATSQLAAGVAALHAAGKLHRDIKPGNVLVTRDGRTVLVDFGLCTDLRLVERARSGLVGTLLYMAPEQAWGKPLGPAADWYGVGAVLFEALTGRPPFEGTGTALLFAKDTPPPVPPLPPRARRLAELAVGLLHPDPDKRLSGDALHDALAEDARSRRDGAAPSLRTPFVGRRDEQAVLEAALREVERGRPAVVDVEGPSGIGKTELLEHFLGAIETRGYVALRGRCHPRESLPYNGFDAIVDALSEWLTAGAPRVEIGLADAAALRALFPVLGRVPALSGETPAPDDPVALRRRAFRALRDLLARLGDQNKIVLALDDAQWGGADTAALLSHVFRPPGTPRVLLVLAYRAEDQETSSFLSALRAPGEVLLDSVHRVALGPLDEADARALAASVLADPDGSARVAREAAGHPFFLRELAFAARAAPDAEHARDLRALLSGRVRGLSPPARALLDLASTASRPLPRRVLLAAAPSDVGGQDVGRLARMRLLRETERGGEPAVEPYHSAVRETARALMDAGEAKRCHRALADALLREPAPEADALVEHLVGSGDRGEAARFAEIAGDAAARVFAFDRAAQLYRLALEAGSTGGRDARALSALRERLASTLANAGRSREAAEAYAEAAREAAASSPTRAADLERHAAEHFLRGGRLDEGIARLRSVLASAGVPYPSSPAAAVATLALHRTKLAVRGLAFRPRAERDVSPSVLARVDACWSAGLGMAWVDRTRTAAFQARFMTLALEAGEPTRVARALATEASQLAGFGGAARTRKGREIMARARAMTEGADPAARAFTLLMAGTIEFFASRYRECVEQCERAEQVLSGAKSRLEWELMTGNTLALAALAHMGELRTLRARQAELLTEASARGNMLANVCFASGPANIAWLATDEPAEAQRRTDEALAPWRGGDFQLPHYLHLVACAQIALYRGDARDALARLRAEWPRVRSSMSLLVQNFRVTLLHMRARAALAAARTERGWLSRARLLRLARADVERLAREDVAWARPLSLGLEGGLELLSGDPAAAAATLARAAEAFTQVDMALYAAAADHERGRVLGGDVGRALLRRAEARMIERRVATPERLAATLIPGV